ncbi:YdcF family protein [Aerosakkonema funiforme]|uniref:YdcF family protein n=1 Tax=Aerosakkonema funiforme FACHB-1375 TaxID=2949571 RepID=A0A926VFC0_9CYAN|nr:YdcF family protein [Aerosakkonema funiforme FACHB-1375]
MVLRTSPSHRRYKLKKTSPSKPRSKRRFLVALTVPIVLWFGYKQVRSLEPPQAVLMLGGSTPALERERFTAKFASQHPNLHIWISSGGPGSYNNYVKKVFVKAGVDLNRLHLDEQAVDTVTNFTTLVDELKARGVNSVYLITSDYHMRRAQVVAEIVLGSRGIVFKPVPVPSGETPEPIEKSIRDGARAILWVATGNTGSSFSKLFSHH